MTLAEYLFNSRKTMSTRKAMEQSGYFKVNIENTKDASNHSEIVSWCRQQIGVEHYCWIDNMFWFETQDQAVYFKLVWG